MNGALFFLVTHSFVNAVMFRLKRLRQPKYLAGAVMGGLYFYFYFFRFLFHGGRPRSDAPTMPVGDLGVEIGALISTPRSPIGSDGPSLRGRPP